VSADTVLLQEPCSSENRSSLPSIDPLDLLFIHHSVGGQWLADPGPESGRDCIYSTHPNGGGLRRALQELGFQVNEASYHSLIGHQTDIHHWPTKFREQMDRILTCHIQDESLPTGRTNSVVMFKSCYPNNAFISEGDEPGQPESPERTLANARAAYRDVLGTLSKHPHVLFVCVTAPPLAPCVRPGPLWKAVGRRMLGRTSPEQDLLDSARLARGFNNWLAAANGWLSGYRYENVVVFDYFGVLSGDGQSDLLQYPTGGGFDSHPSSQGQRIATSRFLPFLKHAMNRTGLMRSAQVP
jgi:hypothetical protein